MSASNNLLFFSRENYLCDVLLHVDERENTVCKQYEIHMKIRRNDGVFLPFVQCYHYDLHISASFDENGVVDGLWRDEYEMLWCQCVRSFDGSIVNKWTEIFQPDAKHLNEVEQKPGIFHTIHKWN